MVRIRRWNSELLQSSPTAVRRSEKTAPVRAMKPGLTHKPQQGIFQAVYTRPTWSQSSTRFIVWKLWNNNDVHIIEWVAASVSSAPLLTNLEIHTHEPCGPTHAMFTSHRCLTWLPGRIPSHEWNKLRWSQTSISCYPMAEHLKELSSVSKDLSLIHIWRCRRRG